MENYKRQLQQKEDDEMKRLSMVKQEKHEQYAEVKAGSARTHISFYGVS